MDQQPYLFNRSVMENIRLARKDATDEEVIEACKKAEIHNVIEKRKEKYKTKIGENGVYVSCPQCVGSGSALTCLPL
jgi:ATP-binding cassette subfamily B protein